MSDYKYNQDQPPPDITVRGEEIKEECMLLTKLPAWVKIGAWIWYDMTMEPDGTPFDFGYGKIEGIKGLKIILQHEISIDVNFAREACIRRWNNKELKSKVGKAFETEWGEVLLCLGYKEIGYEGVLFFAGRGPSQYPAKWLAASNWKCDGFPCGVLEHKNDSGEWVQ